jgi:hypothetical protein
VVSCEAGSEGVRSTGGGAPKHPAEEEAARRKSYEEAEMRARKEENARRNAYTKATYRTETEEKARRDAHDAVMRAANDINAMRELAMKHAAGWQWKKQQGTQH